MRALTAQQTVDEPNAWRFRPASDPARRTENCDRRPSGRPNSIRRKLDRSELSVSVRVTSSKAYSLQCVIARTEDEAIKRRERMLASLAMRSFLEGEIDADDV